MLSKNPSNGRIPGSDAQLDAQRAHAVASSYKLVIFGRGMRGERPESRPNGDRLARVCPSNRGIRDANCAVFKWAGGPTPSPGTEGAKATPNVPGPPGRPDEAHPGTIGRPTPSIAQSIIRR